MTNEKTLIVGTSSAFSDRNLLAKKLDSYLAEVGPFNVVAINDVRGLSRSYFRGKKFSDFPPIALFGDKRKLVRDADWAIFFWDGTGLSEYIYLASLYRTAAKVVPVQTTRVVNRERGEDFDIYIGRGTPWGNPFSIGDNGLDRAGSIEMYKEYFQKKFILDPDGNKAIRTLTGKILACHCKPSACHGDVIAEYLNGLPHEE